METFILVLHLLFAVSVIVLVLLQQGKGADMGASFGSGASGSLFGSSGSANFLSRTTAILAALFFVTSLILTYFTGHQNKSLGVMQGRQQISITKSVKPSGAAIPIAPKGYAVPGDSGSKAGEIPK
ncbi:MAG TPA: preprotein translocase subunit SecG [Burkholderiales bacterium]|nr:preprotein translocase subunit SecG [Burkholderiales bacterium]